MTTKKIPVMHVIRVAYFGATNTRGSRVKVTSDRFDQALTFPFDYALNNIEDMAAEFLQVQGFNIIGMAEGYLITDTFEPFKK